MLCHKVRGPGNNPIVLSCDQTYQVLLVKKRVPAVRIKCTESNTQNDHTWLTQGILQTLFQRGSRRELRIDREETKIWSGFPGSLLPPYFFPTLKESDILLEKDTEVL